MPHYDYKCTACGYTFELFQKMNEEPASFCSSCGGKVKRLIGKGAGPIFKGSGFYQTDYKNSSAAKVSAKEGQADSGGELKKDNNPKKTDEKKGD